MTTYRSINNFEFAALESRVAALESAGGGGLSVTPFNTGSFSEQVTSLPVTSDGSAKRVVFSQQVSVRAGDVILVLAKFEITNPYQYNIMGARYTLLCNSAGATNGTEITEAASMNVTPAIHHDIHVDVGTMTVANGGTKYINVIAWAAASSPGANDALVVEQDYGRLSGVILRPAA